MHLRFNELWSANWAQGSEDAHVWGSGVCKTYTYLFSRFLYGLPLRWAVNEALVVVLQHQRGQGDV